jgi:hypothetical protein
MPTPVKAHPRKGTRGVRSHWRHRFVRIRDLKDPRFTLVDFNQDEVNHIYRNMGKRNVEHYDGALADVSGGDYNEVYVFHGTPDLNKWARRII